MRALAIFLLLLIAPAAWAAAVPVAQVDNPHTRVEIFVESLRARPGAPLWVAVRFTPEPGWHTYWKNYGDSGKEPGLAWSLPEGWSAAEPLYPVPERIPVGPLMNYGYERPQSLLVALTPPADAAPGLVPVRLDADWLVCEEICVPEDAALDFSLAVGEGTADTLAPEVFAAARAALPQPSPWTATAAASANAFRLMLGMDRAEVALVRDAYFFP
ncbi:MAG: protein-disulfide reductase DsbD domain-containing protein, partial [Rhodothalassiaceae bacterium]